MSDTDDLKELVQKAAAGDKASFEELYQETCRSVYFTCLGLLKDEQEAQDVTQDVYLTAFEQLDTLEDTGKFKSWLFRIAANKSINCLKKSNLCFLMMISWNTWKRKRMPQCYGIEQAIEPQEQRKEQTKDILL